MSSQCYQDPVALERLKHLLRWLGCPSETPEQLVIHREPMTETSPDPEVRRMRDIGLTEYFKPCGVYLEKLAEKRCEL